MKTKKLLHFDWAFRHVLQNELHFEILEGFLFELLKEEIKIKSVLTGVDNSPNRKSETSQMDLVVENPEGEIYVVQLYSEREQYYYYRMAFDTSEVIQSYIDSGGVETNIRKVISVNIVYFDIDHGKDYIYKGETKFIGIHNRDHLKMSEVQQSRYKSSDPADMFPDFYILKVHQFDSVTKDKLDEWMYYFKHAEIKEEFSAKGLKEATALLDYERISREGKKEYDKYVEELVYEKNVLRALEYEKETKIRDEERKQTVYDFVSQMKENGLENNVISRITGLTEDEIDSIS